MINYECDEVAKEWADFRNPLVCIRELLPLALTKDDFFLDLGCGQGTHVIAAAHKVAWAYGIDRSSAMLAIARQNATRAHLRNVGWYQLDLGSRFPSQMFPPITKVFSWGALHYLGSTGLSQLASALRRVCAPGAMIYLCTLAFSGPPSVRQAGIDGHVQSTARDSRDWAEKLNQVLTSELVLPLDMIIPFFEEVGFALISRTTNEWGTWAEFSMRLHK